VRLPAKLTAASVIVLPLPGAWAGGLPCPWTRGTVDAVACRKTTRGKRQSQRSRPCMKFAGHRSAQEPGWLVGRLRLGSGMPAPSGQIPPPWEWWENEAPTTRVAGPSQAARDESCSAEECVSEFGPVLATCPLVERFAW
jgi:hypothetical protein